MSNTRGSTIKEDMDNRTQLFMNYIKKANEEDKELNNKFFGHRSNLKPGSVALDENWITGRFIQGEAKNPIGPGRYFTTAPYKITDSSWGGHISVNPKPQYTRYADIRHPSIGRADVTYHSTGNHGMGRRYSEAIDDNAQLIYMQFGKPRFNGLLDFLTSAIDYKDVIVANTGRKPTFYNIGAAVGGFAMLACFPLIFTSIWLIKLGLRILAGNTSFDYYYMQPDMVGYWGTVSAIATAIGSETHLVPLVFDPNSSKEYNKMGIKTSINAEAALEVNKIAPGLISDHGYVDVFKLVTKIQAKSLAYNAARKELIASNDMIPLININGYTNVDLDKIHNARMLTKQNAIVPEEIAKLRDDSVSFHTYATNVIKNGPLGKSDEADKSNEKKYDTPKNNQNKQSSSGSIKESVDAGEATTDREGYALDKSQSDANKKTWLSQFWESLKASASDGGHYAIMTVDYTGTTSSSFSNSVGDIETGLMLKTVATGTRSAKFNMSGGNIGYGIDLGSLLGAGKDLLMGGLESISFGLSNVLATVLGEARVDIPKKWNDSSMDLPRANFTIKLRSPYGNPVSQMQNIWIPLSMLLAGVLPLATGKSSYTSPYLCSVFAQGVCNIKLGMITDLNITAGTTNVGYTRDRRPLGIDVSFTITDFSSLAAAPVNSHVFNVLEDSSFGLGIDDGTPLGRYITTLTGRDFNTNKYTKNKLSIRLTKMFANWEGYFSPAKFGYFIGETVNPIVAPLWFIPQADFDPKIPTHMKETVNRYGH